MDKPPSQQNLRKHSFQTLRSRKHSRAGLKERSASTSRDEAETLPSSASSATATTVVPIGGSLGEASIANGSSASQADGSGSQEELKMLSTKVQEMEQVVHLQNELLRKHQDALEMLQQKLEISQPRPAVARSNTMNMESVVQEPSTSQQGAGLRPFDAQRRAGFGDRRYLGLYDARFHSTSSGATPRDFRILPRRIILVRHGESMGNVDHTAYTYVPDPQVPLSDNGFQQALAAGEKIRSTFEADNMPYKLFFYYSPYLRSKQTYEGIASAFSEDQICGAQEEVQIREQDFGNFQDTERKELEKAERLRFGRFFYRFPNGESGADVYDRITIFEDHMIRDINAGRFSGDTSLVLVTHGLATRVFLMRWFHWTVEQFLKVYNPPNAQPIVLERITSEAESLPGGPASWLHTKTLYQLQPECKELCRGVTNDMLLLKSRRKAILENLPKLD